MGGREPKLSPEIKTFTGVWVNLVDPDPATIFIEDIAHALSQICRFTGHTKKFYSVASHSLRVAAMCSRKHQLSALLHDATEAYLSDINSPLKHTDAMAGYRLLENRMWKCISSKFGIPAGFPLEIVDADEAALREEMSSTDLSARLTPWTGHLGDHELTAPATVERIYLETFKMMNNEREQYG